MSRCYPLQYRPQIIQKAITEADTEPTAPQGGDLGQNFADSFGKATIMANTLGEVHA